MVTVTCACGEVFFADDRHRGQSLRCRRCGTVLTVPVGPPPAPISGPASRPSVWQATAARTFARPRRRKALLALGVACAGVTLVLLFTLTRREPTPSATTQARPPTIGTDAAPWGSTPSSPSADVAGEPRRSKEDRLARLEARACSRAKENPPRTSAVLHAPVGDQDGSLRVANGTNHDAAVFLVDGSMNTVAGVYIQAGATGRLHGIPDGRYEIHYTLGTGWLAGRMRFCEDGSFHAFDVPVTFRTTEESAGDTVWVRKPVLEITLHPVVGGTARTHAISPDRFAPGLAQSRP